MSSLPYQPSHLSVYRGPDSDAAGPKITVASRVRDCYETLMLPDHKAMRSRGTWESYLQSIKWWEQLTADPPIGEIDDDTMAAFRDALAADPKIGSDATVAKHVKNVRAVLRHCGPRFDRNPKGRGILSQLPYCESPVPPRGHTRIIPVDVVGRIYEACKVATWPRDLFVPAPLWWRVALVVFCYYGPRRDELFFKLRWRPDPKKRSDVAGIYWQAECPHPLGSHVRSPHGWLIYHTPKVRGRKRDEPLIQPLNAVTRAHLEAIDVGRVPLFATTKANKSRDKQWDAIQAAAGIEEPYDYQHVRQTCNVRWRGIKDGLGRDVLGQAPRDVNDAYYWNSIEDKIAHIDEVPIPDQFRQPM